MSVPNQNSGKTKPAAGWPVVIFGHAMQGNRSQMLALADTAALAGYAVIAIDFPLHGISPDDPALAPLYVGNTPFAPIANERTFDLDLIDNSTGAPGPDGKADPSGAHFIQLSSLLTNRDNFRQGIADLSTLAMTLPSMDINGDKLPDLDASNIVYAGISLGGIHGTAFTAIEPMVKRAFLSVPMGGVMRGLEASPTIGPRIQAGLAAKGVLPGTSDYELFFIVAQTVFDSADPVNWGAEAARDNSVVLHEVWGDTVFPNYVLTAPLSGTEPLIAAMNLTDYSSTQVAPTGVKLAGRFVPPADHGSFLSPAAAPATTVEMQKQFAAFIATQGTTVVVENAATMVPVVQAESQAVSELKEKSSGKDKKAVNQPNKPGEVSRLESRQTPNTLNNFE
jgi:dienelactone hydrolase